eukprot:CAMPEP_0194139072 /NCGR_PEP_ID=MMETSP0152-20130528/8817_1 /TAXON_ID=1049557 /ORGANISM="Thalassiothrix antarctica, Strain L6-D1" /LENGTH=854 /DNA_ID=CAMNT_0038836807 /DNA_START=68 /DNA_END=2632 /DNA_ORIENTATION=+
MRKETISIISLLALRSDGFTINSSSIIQRKALSTYYPKRARRTVAAFEQKNDFIENNEVSVSDDDESDYNEGASPLQDTDNLPIIDSGELNSNIFIDDENDGGTVRIRSLETGKDTVDDITEKLVKDAAISELKPDSFESQSETTLGSDASKSATESSSTPDFLSQELNSSSNTIDLNSDNILPNESSADDATISETKKSAIDLTRDFLTNNNNKDNSKKNIADVTRDFLNDPVDDKDTADATTTNAVEVILKVSQEAAEAAEATLPEEVSESIPLIPVVQYNNNTIGMEPQILTSSSLSPAEGVVATSLSTTEDNNDFPSTRRILVFAVSATGVFLCNPLLSLIDTSTVGLLSGTVQQAALNPGVAITDYAALCMAFLYTGATNLVAAAREKDRGNDAKPITTSSFTTALQLSGYVGFMLGLTLFVFARQLLKSLIGNDSINIEVFSAAMKYVRIRALGMPASAVIGSAQAGCLGMQDIRSPLYVLVTAALVNLLGDLVFVRMNNSWIGGAAGAAWATVFSQYTAVYFFMRWLCTKPKPKNVNISTAILELTGHGDSQGKKRRTRFFEAIKSFGKPQPVEKSLASKMASVTAKLTPQKKVRFTTRGFLAGKFKSLDLLQFPKAENRKKYYPFVIPVTTTQVGRVSAYVAMSHVVSSTMGTTAMAAQQVIVSLFYCLTPIAESLALTAQSMVPSIVERTPSKQRARALRKSLQNFYRAGTVVGAAMVSAVLCIPFFSQFFTSDLAVAAMVQSVAPYMIGFFSVHGIFMASESLLLAQKDLGFIGWMYACFFVAVPFFMLRVKNSALSGKSVINLTSIWSVFIIYQLIRVAAFVARTLQVQSRTNRRADEAEALL